MMSKNKIKIIIKDAKDVFNKTVVRKSKKKKKKKNENKENDESVLGQRSEEDWRRLIYSFKGETRVYDSDGMEQKYADGIPPFQL